jgi:hypothetical protein
MENSTRADHSNQQVLSREAFEALSLDECKALLAGPQVNLCVDWVQVNSASKRLLMALSPLFNRAVQTNNTPRYWSIPYAKHTPEYLLAISTLCEWMNTICSANKYIPLQPHRIREVSEAMYNMCLGLEIPSYDGHLSDLKQFLESRPDENCAGQEQAN